MSADINDLTEPQQAALAAVIGHLSVCGEGARRRLAVRHIHNLIDAFPQMESLRVDYTGEKADRTPAGPAQCTCPNLGHLAVHDEDCPVPRGWM
jgi:hypothetical protein